MPRWRCRNARVTKEWRVGNAKEVTRPGLATSEPRVVLLVRRPAMRGRGEATLARQNATRVTGLIEESVAAARNAECHALLQPAISRLAVHGQSENIAARDAERYRQSEKSACEARQNGGACAGVEVACVKQAWWQCRAHANQKPPVSGSCSSSSACERLLRGSRRMRRLRSAASCASVQVSRPIASSQPSYGVHRGKGQSVTYPM